KMNDGEIRNIDGVSIRNQQTIDLEVGEESSQTQILRKRALKTRHNHSLELSESY
ncbi:6520_t:CDS:1, partial [Racocetra persica]